MLTSKWGKHQENILWIRYFFFNLGYCLMSDYLGRAWGYGVNDYGQLGLEHMNSYIDTSNPLLIPMFKKQDIFVVDVVASYFGASFAIDNEGKAYRWGANQM